MAMRSMASATISFGLVSIPVRLYSATESAASISFNLLHKPPCGSRLRQQYICIKEEVIVPREEMVKGYEFQKGEYVIFTPEELKELEETSTQTVDITEFVPLDEGRSHLLRSRLFPRSRQGRRQALQAARARDGRDRARGAGALRRARQDVPRAGAAASTTSWSCSSSTTPTRSATSAKCRSVTPRCASRSSSSPSSSSSRSRARRSTPTPTRTRSRSASRSRSSARSKAQEIAVSPTEAKPAQIIDLMEALKASLAKQAAPPAPKKQAKRADAEAAAPPRRPRRTRAKS